MGLVGGVAVHRERRAQGRASSTHATASASAAPSVDLRTTSTSAAVGGEARIAPTETAAKRPVASSSTATIWPSGRPVAAPPRDRRAAREPVGVSNIACISLEAR